MTEAADGQRERMDRDEDCCDAAVYGGTKKADL